MEEAARRMITLDGGELAPESRYVWRARKPGHTLRLICFPYAGAGAANYADWAALLPPDIELVAVQLPGRQNRIANEPFRETGPLIAALSYALRPVLDVPFAFFGHSGGVIAAYELAQALRARGARGPEHLFLSAQPAPGAPAGVRRLHDLPDDEFRAEMLALGGIEPEIADDPDVMDLLLPLLRADFRLWEGYRPSPAPPLDCPITVLCGEDDHRAPLSSLDRWRVCTTADFEIRIYPGGHFYFLPETAELVAFISQRMLGSASNRRS
jgi:medium-chain acyl-[acyl-carrier-protein] hydrolase